MKTTPLQKENPSEFEKDFNAFCQKWQMPGDHAEMTFEGNAYKAYCQHFKNLGMRLTILEVPRVIGSFWFNDNTQEWEKKEQDVRQ